MFKKVKIQPYRIHKLCECGGEYEFSGEVLTIHPPKYVHYCEDCGDRVSFLFKYPKIKYENTGTEITTYKV